MKNKLPFNVIDSDGHIVEPEDKLLEYMEGPYADIKRNMHKFMPNKDGALGYSQIGPSSYFDPTLGNRLGSNGPWGFPTPDDWLATADEGGMETVYLLSLIHISEPTRPY